MYNQSADTIEVLNKSELTGILNKEYKLLRNTSGLSDLEKAKYYSIQGPNIKDFSNKDKQKSNEATKLIKEEKPIVENSNEEDESIRLKSKNKIEASKDNTYYC